MIFYGKQSITDGDIDAVCKTLRSDYLTQGLKVPEFENVLCDCVNSKHAVACNSGTSALHIACLALGLDEGDVLWTSAISFVASANCALYCKAKVDFVDIDVATGLLSVKALAEKLEIAYAKNKLPKIIIPVHYAGQPCDMKSIKKLADKYNVSVIEDASHALGANYLDEPVGNGRFSDITIFSFHPVKMITTGEGGAALTQDPILAEKMNLYRNHGISKDVSLEPWMYHQTVLGYNYRMSDIAATLGISQMQRLSLFLEIRRDIATRYKNNINNVNVVPIQTLGDRLSSYHLYPLLCSDEIVRRRFYDYMYSNQLACQVHYIPIYRQPYYQKIQVKNKHREALPNSEMFYQRVLSLPIYPDMDNDQIKKVISTVNEFTG